MEVPKALPPEPKLLVDEDVAAEVPPETINRCLRRHLKGDCGDISDPDTVMDCLRDFLSGGPFGSVFRPKDIRPLVFHTNPASSQTLVCFLSEWAAKTQPQPPAKNELPNT